MAEEIWSTDSDDGFKIHGVLNSNNNDKLIIFVHGAGGNAYGYAPTQMAFTFPTIGYDVLRLSLYSGLEKSRSYADSTFKILASDINKTFDYFKNKYESIYAIGHSFGGPCLMESHINQFSAVSLWDPSFIPADIIKKKDDNKFQNYYLNLNGRTSIMSEEFIDSALSFDKDHAISLSKKCTIPLQIIYAGKDPYWLPYGESFHTYSQGPTDEKIVPESNHSFHEEGSVEPLLRYVKKWFDQF